MLQRTQALEAANCQLEQLATRDALTGLYQSRRSFDEKLFALLVLDADYFKRVNDTYGHNTGDAVLQQLARILKEQTRSNTLWPAMVAKNLWCCCPRN